MFCRNCGSEIADNDVFCTHCGSEFVRPLQGDNSENDASNTEITSENVELIDDSGFDYYTVNKGKIKEHSKSALIKGILSLSLCFFAIPGIILSRMALNHSDEVLRLSGRDLNGMAKTGRILARIALPFSIISLVYWLFIPLLLFI